MRILVVEDHAKVARFIVKGLREESFAVDLMANGEDALAAAQAVDYDALVLDIMLPGMDGLSVLRAMRSCGLQTPELILTARDRTVDKVDGLNTGADDYLTKPFAFDELLARLRALIRRRQGLSEHTLQLADLAVDCVRHTAERAGNRVDLTPKEFALLSFLMRNSGRVMTRTSIIDHVWDMQFDTGTNIVDVLIRYLRRKIDDDYRPKLIHTVRGVGYVMRVDAC